MNLKWIAIPAAMSLVLLLGPDAGRSQFQLPGGGGQPGGGMGGFGRGGGGGGGRSMDPEAIWAQMGGGTSDTIDLNKNAGLKMMMQMRGSPIPPDGILRKEQWKTDFQNRMASRGGPQGMGGPPGMGGPTMMSVPAATTPGSADAVVAITPGGPAPTTPGAPSWGGLGGRGGLGVPRGGVWGGGGGGGGDDMESYFKRLSGGSDKISREQANQSRRGLGQEFDKYDSNRDGFIDMNEYKAFYAVAYSSNGQQGSGGPGGWGGGGQGQDPRKIEDPDDVRPTVFRYGKLPKDFEKEFGALDSDKDGQVGLYEWRTIGRDLEKFTQLDLNGDGYLTAEEYLRFQRIASTARPAEGSSRPGGGTPSWGGGGNSGGGAPSWGGGGNPGGGAPSWGGGRFGQGGTPPSVEQPTDKDKPKDNKDNKNSRDRGGPPSGKGPRG